MNRKWVILIAVLFLPACSDDSTTLPDGAACQGVYCDRPFLDALGMDPFYQKYVDAGGIPVISTEVTTEIPEHRHLANDPNTDWNKRARGLGGAPNYPITTAGEATYEAALDQGLWADT